MLRVMNKRNTRERLNRAWDTLKMKSKSLINDGEGRYFIVSSYNEEKDMIAVCEIDESCLEKMVLSQPFSFFSYRTKDSFKVINILI